MRRRTRTFQIALCGVLGALSVAILAMGGLLPLATYCAPMLAGIALVPVLGECPQKYGWMTWAAVSVLAVLLVPDRELSLVYALVLGPYPMLKRRIDRLGSAWVRTLCRLIVFNLAVLVCYGLLLVVFPLPGLMEGFTAGGALLTAATLVTGNLAFLVYDAALRAVAVLYARRLRPLLRFLH